MPELPLTEPERAAMRTSRAVDVVLAVLAAIGPARPSTIARRTGLHRGTVRRAIDALTGQKPRKTAKCINCIGMHDHDRSPPALALVPPPSPAPAAGEAIPAASPDPSPAPAATPAKRAKKGGGARRPARRSPPPLRLVTP